MNTQTDTEGDVTRDFRLWSQPAVFQIVFVPVVCWFRPKKKKRRKNPVTTMIYTDINSVKTKNKTFSSSKRKVVIAKTKLLTKYAFRLLFQAKSTFNTIVAADLVTVTHTIFRFVWIHCFCYLFIRLQFDIHKKKSWMSGSCVEMCTNPYLHKHYTPDQAKKLVCNYYYIFFALYTYSFHYIIFHNKFEKTIEFTINNVEVQRTCNTWTSTEREIEKNGNEKSINYQYILTRNIDFFLFRVHVDDDNGDDDCWPELYGTA